MSTTRVDVVALLVAVLVAVLLDIRIIRINLCKNMIAVKRIVSGLSGLNFDSLTEPVVIENAINASNQSSTTTTTSSWRAASWNFQSLRERIGSRVVPADFYPRDRADPHEIAWETNRTRLHVEFCDFIDWCSGSIGTTKPQSILNTIDKSKFWGYVSYEYLFRLMDECDDIDWRIFGGRAASKSALDSTLWVGTRGASTPTHYDSYGNNFVVQLFGRKRWILVDPKFTPSMYASRIPFEESSVWSSVCVSSPDLQKHPMFANVQPMETILKPGDALFVPRHWWHYVECIDDSISVNLWTEHDADRFEQVKEAAARVLFGLIVNNNSNDDDDDDDNNNDDDDDDELLNPTEESLSFDENLEMLSSTITKFNNNNNNNNNNDNNNTNNDDISEISRRKLAEVLLCGDVLELIAMKLTQQQHR